MTQEESRLLIRELMDDVDAKRWSELALDLLVDTVQDWTFGQILKHSPYYNSQLDTVATLTSPGYIDTSSGGDLSARLFRIQKVTRDGKEYSEIKASEVVLEDNTLQVGPRQVYLPLGTQIWLFPLETTPEVEVRYNFRPAKWSSLDDQASLAWPDGNEDAFICEAVGRALAKGAAEDPSVFLQMAQRARDDMLGELARRAHGPLTMMVTDAPADFASVD